MNKKEVEQAIKGYEYIENLLSKFGEEFEEHFAGNAHVTDVELDGDVISLRTEVYYCGDTDWTSYILPASYLWEDDWPALETIRRAEVKEAEALKKVKNAEAAKLALKKKKLEDAKKKIENEKKMLAELKAKYE